MSKKVRLRIPQEAKIRAVLQQEISSVCPLCDNNDVGHFQIHHIDGNPQNNLIDNLILLCPTCHSKITKGDILRTEVEEIKALLPNSNIEFVSVGIDSKNCAWTAYEGGSTNAFWNQKNEKSPLPILDFRFINQSKRIIVLIAIQIEAKYLPSGIYGLHKPAILNSSVTYRLSIPNNDKTILHQLERPLEVPAEKAFRFKIELFTQGEGNEVFTVIGKKVLRLTFVFGSYTVNSPDIFLNCKNQHDEISIVYLG